MALMAAARQRFGEVGYHATGTHDLVALAGVTRGALYHHFADKPAIFEAVFVEVHNEVRMAARTIGGEAMTGDVWANLVTVLTKYLQITAEKTDVQRIILVDGPAVLGWQRWRELQDDTRSGLVATMELLMERGLIAQRKPGVLAHLIMATLNEAALSIAYADDSREALHDALDALLAILVGLRIPVV